MLKNRCYLSYHAVATYKVKTSQEYDLDEPFNNIKEDHSNKVRHFVKNCALKLATASVLGGIATSTLGAYELFLKEKNSIVDAKNSTAVVEAFELIEQRTPLEKCLIGFNLICIGQLLSLHLSKQKNSRS